METQPAIKNHLVLAILTTLFCCLPFGIVAIVYASRVDSLAIAGNLAGAQEASRKAKFWGMLSVWSAFGLWILYILLMLFGILIGGAADAMPVNNL